LRRLPADWEPPLITSAQKTNEQSFEIVERPRGSLSARAFGTVVHALLEELATQGASSAIPAEVASWRPRALTMLRTNGLPRAEAEPQSAEVVRALTAVLKDPTGCWILGARAGARSEISWSAWAAIEGDCETVRSLRGDRIFRAGATPGSTEETHLWIVDYKTATHGTSGLDTFLEGEKSKYQPQLEAYAAVMRKVQGENLPICLALYYPLLSRLVWW
jgi:ATP-dependent exoDNAse (exonuclease V) beta subunit